jgi:hypothetical protein
MSEESARRDARAAHCVPTAPVTGYERRRLLRETDAMTNLELRLVAAGCAAVDRAVRHRHEVQGGQRE